MEQTATALAALTEATQLDWSTVTEIAKANTALTKTNATLMVQLSTTNKALTNLTNMVKQMQGN